MGLGAIVGGLAIVGGEGGVVEGCSVGGGGGRDGAVIEGALGGGLLDWWRGGSL